MANMSTETAAAGKNKSKKRGYDSYTLNLMKVMLRKITSQMMNSIKKFIDALPC